MDRVDNFYLYYNGHGPIFTDPSKMHEAGAWLCANKEVIDMKEVFEIINEKADQ